MHALRALDDEVQLALEVGDAAGEVLAAPGGEPGERDGGGARGDRGGLRCERRGGGDQRGGSGTRARHGAPARAHLRLPGDVVHAVVTAAQGTHWMVDAGLRK